MTSIDQTYTYQEFINRVRVIGFSGVPRVVIDPEAHERFVEESRYRIITLTTNLPPHPAQLAYSLAWQRLREELANHLDTVGENGSPEFAILDFSNTDVSAENRAFGDNGRATVSLVLKAQRRLMAQGGGILVCNHQLQFNPEMKNLFGLNKVIEMFGSREAALESALSHQRGLSRPDETESIQNM